MSKIKNYIKFTGELLHLYRIRNKCILRDERFSIKNGKVNLHYWKFGRKSENLGDYLSSVVVDFMKEYYALDDSYSCKTKHLYAIGSILQAGRQNATVWGSGFLDPLTHRLSKYMKYFRKLDIRIVRGPNTRKHLLKLGYKCPEIYGVPAILYKPDNAQTTLFKFEDYYFSTNRFEFPVAKSIEEALTLTPCALPELSEIQNNLIKTFPKDLWGK